MVLHAVALPDDLDGGDGWVRESRAPGRRDPPVGSRACAPPCAEGGVPAVATAVTEVGPDQPGFAVLLRNALAQQIAARIGPRLVEEGLHADAGPAARPGRPGAGRLASHRDRPRPARWIARASTGCRGGSCRPFLPEGRGMSEAMRALPAPAGSASSSTGWRGAAAGPSES